MQRYHKGVLIGSTVLGSWLGMQAAHESGHLLAAALSRGHIARVVLHPLALSRTELWSNPRPLVVAWAGPLVGVLLPLALWAIAAGFRSQGAFALRFFAGFCLIANGAYLAFGSLARVGDAGELLRLGSPAWSLWMFGLFAAPSGLWLWHRQGRHFGLGTPGGRVAPGVVYASVVACLSLVGLGLFLGGG